MNYTKILRMETFDARYSLPEGAGSDAVHSNPEYCLAVTRLRTDSSHVGTGFALTLGQGNRLVCDVIQLLSESLVGISIEDLMVDFGNISRKLADDAALRWLGPHKGVVHLALASIVNACFDLWAKQRQIPLWQLLLSLSPESIVQLLDLSYLEDALTREEALSLLHSQWDSRPQRKAILKDGYPGYDTSVGWMAYDDNKVRELTARAIDQGFAAFKLKVGSPDQSRDLRRANMLREFAGDHSTIMFDANQQWSLPTALTMCNRLASLQPLWIEEPTHPDDVLAHVQLAKHIAPVKIASGEHFPNKVVFKNFIKAGAVHYVQADCTRLGGVSEFITVSLLAKKFGLPVVPHVGDMGQLHQHLVLFNHIALNHDSLFLEHIPHLHDHFVMPAQVAHGRYKTPQEPGASADLKELQDA
jgi:L-fuconate dehydratase